MLKKWLTRFAWMALAAGLGAAAQAQPYPNKPVTIIVPLGAGGVADVLTRTLAAGLQERTGQAFIVENKPGANTRITAEACAGAAPTGYTLCLLSASTLSINPFVYDKLRYSVDKSFEPITNLVAAEVLLAVHPSVPAKTWPDLVAYSKANPDKLNYASFGAGSDVHLTMEQLRKHAGAQMTHVPFNGFPPILQAVGSGDIQVVFVGLGNPGVVDLVKSGKLKPIALHAPSRSALLPDVPTFAEAGLPKIDVFTWFGLFAPAGTPKSVVDTLNADITSVMKSAPFVERSRALALTPMNGSAAGFASFLVKDRADWEQLVKSAAVKLE